MIIKVVLLVVLAIICGIVSLVAFILFLTNLKEPSKRNTWLIVFSITFVVALTLGIYLVVKAVTKTVQKAVEVGQVIEEKARNFDSDLAKIWIDDRSYLLESSNQNKEVLFLKSLEPDSFKGKVPSGFYTSFGFRDWYRCPLVYPYSMHCVDGMNYGQLSDDRDVTEFTMSYEGRELQLYDITGFTFDKNIMLIKKVKSRDLYGDAVNEVYEFVVFHFADEQEEKFDTEEALFKRAKALDFKGDDKLMAIREYDALF